MSAAEARMLVKHVLRDCALCNGRGLVGVDDEKATVVGEVLAEVAAADIAGSRGGPMMSVAYELAISEAARHIREALRVRRILAGGK